MRVLCAKKESALGVRGAIPGFEALGRKGFGRPGQRETTGAVVCRLLEVESEGAAFGERASAIGEADRRGGTLVCLALRPARGTNISAPSTRAPRDWPAGLDGNPMSERGRRRFLAERRQELAAAPVVQEVLRRAVRSSRRQSPALRKRTGRMSHPTTRAAGTATWLDRPGGETAHSDRGRRERAAT